MQHIIWQTNNLLLNNRIYNFIKTLLKKKFYEIIFFYYFFQIFICNLLFGRIFFFICNAWFGSILVYLCKFVFVCVCECVFYVYVCVRTRQVISKKKHFDQLDLDFPLSFSNVHKNVTALNLLVKNRCFFNVFNALFMDWYFLFLVLLLFHSL